MSFNTFKNTPCGFVVFKSPYSSHVVTLNYLGWENEASIATEVKWYKERGYKLVTHFVKGVNLEGE
jgi:hypothetical protein